MGEFSLLSDYGPITSCKIPEKKLRVMKGPFYPTAQPNFTQLGHRQTCHSKLIDLACFFR